MPAVKSRNWLPSTSVTQQPRPRSITNGYARVKLGDIALASRTINSATFGLGSADLISGLTLGKLAERAPPLWGGAGVGRRSGDIIAAMAKAEPPHLQPH